MANTDFDGSPIVILSENEARQIYYRLTDISKLDLNDIEQGVVRKIAHDLKLEEDMEVRSDFNQKGTWRLSNEQLTIRVEVDSDNNIQSVASVAHRFLGQSLNNLARWMNRIGKTDIMLLKKIPYRGHQYSPLDSKGLSGGRDKD